MFPTPVRVFFTRGIGVHRHALTAFEVALRDADIESLSMTAATAGDAHARWTCAVSAAVFLFA